MAVVTPIDRRKSVANRSVIDIYGRVFLHFDFLSFLLV